MKISELAIKQSRCPVDGTYKALADGYTVTFKDSTDTTYTAKSSTCGVKGHDIPDTVTVSSGKITSDMLGECDLM